MGAVKKSNSKLSDQAKERMKLWIKEHVGQDGRFPLTEEALGSLIKEVEEIDRREWPHRNFCLAIMRFSGRAKPSGTQTGTISALTPKSVKSIRGRKAACKKEIERVMDKARRSLCRAVGRFITKESGVSDSLKKRVKQLELELRAKDKELKDIRNVLHKYEPVETAIMEFSGKKLEMTDWVRLVKKLEAAVLAARKALQGF